MGEDQLRRVATAGVVGGDRPLAIVVTGGIPAHKPVDLARGAGYDQAECLAEGDCVRSVVRKVVGMCILLGATVALFAQSAGPAVLSGTGSIYLNGAQVSTPSSPVTVGDIIQTKENGAANINAPGSTVAVDSNSIVRYRPEGLALDRGSLSVATGQGMSVFARDFKITPVANSWTQFYVTRSSGAIGVIARKGAVNVTCGTNSTTVQEGQQISREDAANCGLVDKATGAPVAAKGPILTSTRAELGALAAGGALAGWALIHNDEPVSPRVP